MRSELGHLSIQKLTRRDIDGLIQRLRDGSVAHAKGEGRRRKWGPRSCNYMLVALSQVFKQLVKDGTVLRNIVEDINRVPGKPKKFGTYTPGTGGILCYEPSAAAATAMPGTWPSTGCGAVRSAGCGWTEAVAAAGVPHIRLHDARHTCGTTMHLQGVPPAVIAAWLGHADVSFTMRTYVHSQPDALAEGARTLARIVTIRDNSTGG